MHNTGIDRASCQFLPVARCGYASLHAAGIVEVASNTHAPSQVSAPDTDGVNLLASGHDFLREPNFTAFIFVQGRFTIASRNIKESPPWCPEKVPSVGDASRCGSEDSLNLWRRAIEIDSLYLTSGFDCIEQVVILIVEEIMVPEAVVTCIKPGPIGVPNPGKGDVVEGGRVAVAIAGGVEGVWALNVRGGEAELTDGQDYGAAGRMDTNDSLRLANLFDVPIASFTPGTKIFVVCQTGAPNMENLLKVIYELYTDFVLKNPFYEMEMPIRCELFDLNLSQVIQKDRVALLGR
ncbi:hypothetical protein PR202_ga23289 [Eleusine coracana subsp. coracana]|uniref:Trafficking protein particle complex subunit n=1 Tax=Eleusine coracana subsp. coracana TaxID=191504 RepID=A0AAV5D4U6_ELECO|nr:hypothetical protein PR202_ga23289 [Eleusine coracana subsp. coracana]